MLISNEQKQFKSYKVFTAVIFAGKDSRDRILGVYAPVLYCTCLGSLGIAVKRNNPVCFNSTQGDKVSQLIHHRHLIYNPMSMSETSLLLSLAFSRDANMVSLANIN